MTTVNEMMQNRTCVRCVMDANVDRTIFFDRSGLCNHCQRYDRLVSSRVLGGEIGQRALEALVDRIIHAGRNREYDCIVGVSGGVDSTYVAYLAKQLGLRPLAVHFDNGWNSELAVKNIERVLRKLDMELYTYVVDWEEFKDLQLSFLKASVPDGEIPTDHAINAVLWRQACKLGIRYILSGMNFATESFSLPDWAYGHSDWRYIKDIHRRFGTVKLKTYPRFSATFLAYANLVRRVKVVSILNYIDYHKEEAMELLHRELGWEYYGGKHYESIYTRFYQSYVLPRKFGIDKRYAHLSDLINAGQLDKDTALEELRKLPYPAALQRQDREYVSKKLGISQADFERMMKLPIKSFRDFRNNYALVQFLRRTANTLRRTGLYPR